MLSAVPKDKADSQILTGYSGYHRKPNLVIVLLHFKVYILVARRFGNQDYRAAEQPQQLYLENCPCIL